MARTSVAPINATRTSGGLGGRMFRKSVASAKSSTADAAWPSLSKRRRVCGRRTTTAQRSVAGAIAAARQCRWPTRRVRGQKDARGGLDVRQLEPSDVGCRSRVTRNTAAAFRAKRAAGGHRRPPVANVVLHVCERVSLCHDVPGCRARAAPRDGPGGAAGGGARRAATGARRRPRGRRGRPFRWPAAAANVSPARCRSCRGRTPTAASSKQVPVWSSSFSRFGSSGPTLNP